MTAIKPEERKSEKKRGTTNQVYISYYHIILLNTTKVFKKRSVRDYDRNVMAFGVHNVLAFGVSITSMH